jgi:hypothetical protein
MISQHAFCVQSTHPDTNVWRFMDLSKFVDLLQQRRLFFASLGALGDPFEGTITRRSAETAPEVIRHRYVEQILQNKADPTEKVVEYMQASMKKARKHFRDEQAFVSCWHINEHESAAMWKLYSQSSDAVCIRSTYSTLATLLPAFAFMGVVQYIDYAEDLINIGDFISPIMHKRKSFEHEREVRAIVCKVNGIIDRNDGRACVAAGGVKVEMDLNALINHVFVSPTSPVWFKDVVENLAIEYGLDAPVRHSNLLASPIY